MNPREGAQSVQEYRASVEAGGRQRSMVIKPTERGDYNFCARWCFSAAPVYASFDGTNWVREGQYGGVKVVEYTEEDECFYYIKPYPYGSKNPGILRPEELPLKQDLQSRLERFKKAKANEGNKA